MVSEKQLKDMANVLRRDVIGMTTEAESGHPTSCMSMAEIMSVLFFREMKYDTKNPFNPDNDEFVLSKGHAAPILYASLFRAGCIKDDLMKLRKLNSPLEGHPVPKSLKWVKVATGSLGQGLSVGVGMALAAKKQKRKYHTYVLLGDSESAEGSVFEALELGSYYKLDNLTAIIDINRLGQRGETMLKHDTEKYKKMFKGFGWKIIQINGHDLKQIINAVAKSKESTKPTLILAKTEKGKGFSLVEGEEGRHGKALNKEEMDKAFEEIPNPKIPKIEIKKPNKVKASKQEKEKIELPKYKLGEEIATRDAYGEVLAALAKSDSEIIATDGEVSNSTRSGKVKEESPEQFVEAFIAEQNMVGMALGMSVKGFNVFASSFSAFLSRAHDQIRMAAVSTPPKLTFCGSHAGVSIGEDGASQMGLEDISMFRTLPDSYVFYPSDAVSASKLTVHASKLKGIKYIRTTRPKTHVIYENNEKFDVGDFKVLKESKNDKAVLVGSGITTHEALKAYDELKDKKKNVAVVDLYCIKPFNSKKFIEFVKKHGNKIIIAEDHYAEGGIGDMLANELMKSGESKIEFRHLAVKEIPHSGTKDELLKKYGINWEAYVKSV